MATNDELPEPLKDSAELLQEQIGDETLQGIRTGN
jgi:hypothetical protein